MNRTGTSARSKAALFAALGAALLGAVSTIGVGCSREGGAVRGGSEDRATSVLLVTLDTTRRDHFGCYGYPQPITPNFDALASEGVRFDRAYSTASVTPVSHASILTGLNPYQHQARVIAAASGFRLHESVPTLATILRTQGRRTAAFLSAFSVSEYYGLERGFDTWDNGLTVAADDVITSQQGGSHLAWDANVHQRRSDATTDRFLAWLEKGSGPFFAWIHYWDPHDAVILPPREFIEKFRPDGQRPTDQLRALYAAEVHYVDAQFGRIVSALRTRGEYDRTIVVVIADHGEGLGEHNWWFHRLLYEEQIHVPMLMRIPGAATGVVVTPVVRCTDILPTVTDYLRIAPSGATFGRSLRPLLEGRAEPPRPAYADALNKFDQNSNLHKQRPRDGLLYAVIQGDWKLIHNDEHADAHQLYNLANDPEESRNLFTQRPERARELKALLDSWQPYQREPFSSGPLDPAALRALQSLGYVGDTEEAAETQPAGEGP